MFYVVVHQRRPSLSELMSVALFRDPMEAKLRSYRDTHVKLVRTDERFWSLDPFFATPTRAKRGRESQLSAARLQPSSDVLFSGHFCEQTFCAHTICTPCLEVVRKVQSLVES